MERESKIFTAVTVAFLLVAALIFMYIMSHNKPKKACEPVVVTATSQEQPNQTAQQDPKSFAQQI